MDPGSTLYKGKCKFFDIEGLSSLTGVSGGGFGALILLMSLNAAALVADEVGAS